MVAILNFCKTLKKSHAQHISIIVGDVIVKFE